MKLNRFSILAFFCLVIVGCNTTKPRYNTALDDIHSALAQAHTVDSKIAYHSNKNQMPLAVKNALLPSLAVDNGAGGPSVFEPRFDVSVKDAPAAAFFSGLVQGTKYSMVLSPDIKGTISISLKNVTLDEALEAVRDAYGYDFEKTDYGYKVLPSGLQTRMFTVNYLDVARNGLSQTTLSSSEAGFSSSGGSGGGGATGGTPTTPEGGQSGAAGSTGSVSTSSQMDFWKSLSDTLKTMVGTGAGRSVVVNPEAGVVIVHANQSELREIGEYLGSVQNNMQRQVIIEAKVLEVQLSKNYQAGVNWGVLNQYLNPANLPANAAAIMQGAVTPIPYLDGSSTPNYLNSIVVTDNHSNFNAVIQLLEQQGNVQTLSNPRVSTTNNQKAVIKVGSNAYFVTSVTTTQVPSGATTQQQSTVELTPFFSGITLDVTPQIGSDGNIILQIHPSVSTVKEEQKTIALGAGGNLNLPLARSTMRETDSIVHAKNGQIIVLGGLMQNNTSEQLNSTPLLGRIPFIGALFRSTGQVSSKSELVILLRPVIVNNNVWANTAAETDARFRSLKRGFHVSSIPEDFGVEGEKLKQ